MRAFHNDRLTVVIDGFLRLIVLRGFRCVEMFDSRTKTINVQRYVTI